jgi:hypothetical protein
VKILRVCVGKRARVGGPNVLVDTNRGSLERASDLCSVVRTGGG